MEPVSRVFRCLWIGARLRRSPSARSELGLKKNTPCSGELLASRGGFRRGSPGITAHIVMACIVMAYTVMALYSYCPI